MDEIINTLTLRMEKIIEESTIRIFNSIMKKINRIEKSLSSNKHLITEQATDPESEEEEPEQINNIQTTTTKIKPSTSSGTSNHSKSNAQTTSNVSTELLNDEQSAVTTKKSNDKPGNANQNKRNRSLNSSMESGPKQDNKDMKLDENDD